MYVVKIRGLEVACSLIEINDQSDVVAQIEGPLFPVEWEELFDYVDTLSLFKVHRMLWTMTSTLTYVRIVVPVEYTEIVGKGSPIIGHRAPTSFANGSCRSIGLASPMCTVVECNSR